MNGFAMWAEMFRKLMEQGKMEKKAAEKEIRIYDFLAECDVDDFCMLVDSTAFNPIIRAYLKLSMENVGIDEESREKVLIELSWLFDEKEAREILEYA